MLLLLCGALALATGLLVPAHLRAVDPRVLQQMESGKTLPVLAIETATTNEAAAKVLLLAAEQLELAGTDAALDFLRETQRNPQNPTAMQQLEMERAGLGRVQEVPVLVALRPSAARFRIANSLSSPEARQVLANRSLTNLSLFAPVTSAAGFPFEASILTTAFLIEERAFAPMLHREVVELAGSPQVEELEEFYINVLALAKRFSSAQIIGLIQRLPTIEALDAVTRAFQNHPDHESLVYASVLASNDGEAAANYIRAHHQTALADLSLALGSGLAPFNYLVSSGDPVFRSDVFDEFAADPRLRGIFEPLLGLAIRSPAAALLVKFLLLASGAFCLAYAGRFAKQAAENGYVLIPRFVLIRRAAAAAVLLVLLIIIGEPYLARGGAEEPERPRVSFNFAALTAPPVAPSQTSSFMIDPQTLLAMATFLVLQSAIYVVCLVKLAEIRKQPVPSATKLKLLENEENLFDGGLYAGLFGTAASLILLTVGAIKPSLISAYSSTLFGILSVALIKIVHVRPYKRRLILDTPEGQRS